MKPASHRLTIGWNQLNGFIDKKDFQTGNSENDMLNVIHHTELSNFLYFRLFSYPSERYCPQQSLDTFKKHPIVEMHGCDSQLEVSVSTLICHLVRCLLELLLTSQLWQRFVSMRGWCNKTRPVQICKLKIPKLQLHTGLWHMHARSCTVRSSGGLFLSPGASGHDTALLGASSGDVAIVAIVAMVPRPRKRLCTRCRDNAA